MVSVAGSRVVFLTGSPVMWGAELSMIAIASNAPEGVTSALVCSSAELEAEWREVVGQDVTRFETRTGRLSRNLGFVSGLPGKLRRGDCLVLFDFYLLPAVALLLPYLKAHDIRVVVDIHDGVLGNPRRRPFFWLMQYADQCIAISDFIAAQVPRLNATVVHRGVTDLQPARSVPLRAEAEPHIGIVGQIQPTKGTEFALRAVASSGVSAEVHVRGSASAEFSSYEKSVQVLAENLFGSRAHFDGSLSRGVVMQGLDIVFCANANEPFGRVMVESQLAGAVVVAPRSGGALEILDDAVTGHLYDVGQIEDASRALIAAASSVRDREFVARARRTALENFNPVVQSRKYFTVVLGKNGRRSRRAFRFIPIPTKR